MNDFRDLKAIAEACQQHQTLRFMPSHGALYIRNDNGIVFDVHQNRSFPEFMAQNKDYADLILAASPSIILALIAENERLQDCEDVLRQLASYVGAGGYNAPEVDPEVFARKILDGINILNDPLAQLVIEKGERIAQLKAECEALRNAAVKVIEMNRQHAKDQYGDAEKAESWSCVTVLRAAIGNGEQS
ncbi:hypothetical protein [Pseudomonas vancouverensis]|uniref:Uncharacterized protein n=1 Tax=Pseudomonas vancouverensis TaxID=95300 RepID=A0A1H2MUW1_PSEVA|nr:hypothetical protein [Pseudomonas vancouverensis]KAB0489710.1 hypothetical protein F7R09_28760 [Pseudomonas vancouverensis]TDB67206.1 hypothetical protein EIY72_03930 [Pseudomonas vancouverensis]SDU96852.1 hypothetical protein SAMN05216558_1290 [Pseudomonas vancouverensis]